jgi:hypothetical protein
MTNYYTEAEQQLAKSYANNIIDLRPLVRALPRKPRWYKHIFLKLERDHGYKGFAKSLRGVFLIFLYLDCYLNADYFVRIYHTSEDGRYYSFHDLFTQAMAHAPSLVAKLYQQIRNLVPVDVPFEEWVERVTWKIFLERMQECQLENDSSESTDELADKTNPPTTECGKEEKDETDRSTTEAACDTADSTELSLSDTTTDEVDGTGLSAIDSFAMDTLTSSGDGYDTDLSTSDESLSDESDEDSWWENDCHQVI